MCACWCEDFVGDCCCCWGVDHHSSHICWEPWTNSSEIQCQCFQVLQNSSRTHRQGAWCTFGFWTSSSNGNEQSFLTHHSSTSILIFFLNKKNGFEANKPLFMNKLWNHVHCSSRRQGVGVKQIILVFVVVVVVVPSLCWHGCWWQKNCTNSWRVLLHNVNVKENKLLLLLLMRWCSYCGCCFCGVQIYSLDWSYRERTRIVSASQDGRLIVWNAISSQKTHAIKLPCAWVMACAFSPSGHAVACGGLDNVCSIFNLNSTADKDGNLPLSCALVGHKGYLSCCRYVPDEEAHIITSSGDHTCIMWDAETSQRIALFGGDSPAGHTSDVMRYSYRWGRWWRFW